MSKRRSRRRRRKQISRAKLQSEQIQQEQPTERKVLYFLQREGVFVERSGDYTHVKSFAFTDCVMLLIYDEKKLFAAHVDRFTILGEELWNTISSEFGKEPGDLKYRTIRLSREFSSATPQFKHYDRVSDLICDRIQSFLAKWQINWEIDNRRGEHKQYDIEIDLVSLKPRLVKVDLGELAKVKRVSVGYGPLTLYAHLIPFNLKDPQQRKSLLLLLYRANSERFELVDSIEVVKAVVEKNIRAWYDIPEKFTEACYWQREKCLLEELRYIGPDVEEELLLNLEKAAANRIRNFWPGLKQVAETLRKEDSEETTRLSTNQDAMFGISSVEQEVERVEEQAIPLPKFLRLDRRQN